jgi:hypothetical protein
MGSPDTNSKEKLMEFVRSFVSVLVSTNTEPFKYEVTEKNSNKKIQLIYSYEKELIEIDEKK